MKDKAQQIIDYIDGFYVSGNSVPIDKPWISAGSWEIAKELLALGLPLEHDLIEREGVYRKKLLAYGDETRAQSPLQLRLAAARTSPAIATAQITPDGAERDRKDAERLEWLSGPDRHVTRRDCDMVRSDPCYGKQVSFFRNGGRITVEGETLREAIDKAIKAGG